MKISRIFPLFSTALLLSGNAFAAAYSTDFNLYTTPGPVAPQDGWVNFDANQQLTYMVVQNVSPAAALGGAYGESTAARVELEREVELPFVGTTLLADVTIISSDIAHPSQDSFGYSLRGPGESNLLTIFFEPSLTDPLLLDIKYSTGASVFTTAGSFSYGGTAPLIVSITGAGADAAFTASFGTFDFNGSLTGLGASQIESFGINWDRLDATYGNNYIVTDNLAIIPTPIPEVSSSLLVLGAVAPLLRRRRK